MLLQSIASSSAAEAGVARIAPSHAAAATAMTDNWDITTGDGSVAVYLPEGFSGELDAHTGDGTVRSDLAAFSSTNGENARRTLRGRIGAGGKLLRIRTGDGSIRLRTN